MFDVVALGELLIDFTCLSVDEAGYPTLAAHPGGAPANFLAALAQYGAKTALIGKVGRDAFGAMLTRTLERAGIDVSGLRAAEDVFTTLAFVTLDGQGNRAFSFARKPGADTCLSREEIDLSLLDAARVFHFGTLSLTDEPARSATRAAVAYARERGALLTFDPNLRPPLWRNLEEAREQMLWGLGQADVVKISDEEVRFLFQCGPEAGAERLHREMGVPLVFVTCGGEGCFFHSARAHGHEAGLSARGTADSILSSLHSAGSWGTFDLLGGGLVADLAKHSHLDSAQDQIETLQIQLSRFRTELSDVTIHADIQAQVDGFLRFADYFFDGLFVDWMVLDRIQQSEAQVQNTADRIGDVLRRLYDMQAACQTATQDAQAELDQLVNDA